MRERDALHLAIKNFERERIIGEIMVYLPKPPNFTKIANFNLRIADQKFQYTKQPDKGKEPSDEFLAQEFDRFENGYWFFNNGNVEWISPNHYFFLNYWKDKGKNMKFIDSQREAFLWWWQIERMEYMAGGNLISNRRFGKTVFGTCVLYWRSSTNANFRGGIQSKTNPDSKLVFNKLIKSWQKLPDWLKPVDSGETRPATVLDFTEPRSSTKKGKKVYEEVLDSSIDFRSSSADAYDGDELHTYYEDEFGKSVEVNTDERWGVVQFCLLIGSDLVGKALRTTTVEEMEKKGGKHAKKTWDDSAIKTLNPETGMTTSMLTNLFIPADFGFKGRHPVTKQPFVDEYGISNRKLATEYIESLWTNLEGTKLAAAQRKNPLKIKHAFQLQNFDSVFDNELLEEQKEYLENEAPKTLRRRVTFAKDDDGLVKWRDDPRGYHEMVWDFEKPSESNRRVVNRETQLYMPNNVGGFAAGVDPFAATITTGPGSMGVCYIYKKGDPLDPENSGFCVLRYAQRTRYKADFHKNVMLLCQYYGCKANYESDVDDYYEKFIESGFKHYIMWRPKSTVDPQRRNVKTKYGTPSKDPFALQKHTEVIDEYIKLHHHKIYFPELIDQLIDYDVNDRTKFDDVIAFGMSLIGGMDGAGKSNEPVKVKKFLELRRTKRYA